MPWSRFTCIRVNAEDWIEMKTTQHHGYVVFMPMMICLIFTFMADAFGYGKDIEKKSEEFYLLVGNVERCEYISGVARDIEIVAFAATSLISM